jgi:hypothetical protein
VVTRASLPGGLIAALVLASCDGAGPAASSGGASVPPQPGRADTSDEGAGGGEIDPSTERAPDITDVLAQLVESIGANGGAYDAVDRADLNDVLTLALVLASSPGGRGDVAAECVARAATLGFSHAQAAKLCADVRFDSAACAAQALPALQFDREAAVALCAGRGSTETADCAQTAVTLLGSSPARAAAVCADREGASVAACVGAARAVGFDAEQTITLCARRGGASTAACARSAFAAGFTREQSVALCAERGALETFRCASAAFAGFGFSRQQAIDLCSNRGQEGNATCASRVLVLGATRDQAVEACRRPPTLLVP